MRYVWVLVLVLVGLNVWVGTAHALEPRGYIGKGQPWETPYYVIQGAKNGPTIMVLGGTHGDEIAGWRAAEQLLSASINCGKLVVIPRANIRAVKQNVREVAKEGNLNRAYPGEQDGTLTEKLALDIMNLIRSCKPIAVLDLHESYGFAGEGNDYLGQTIIAYAEERSSQLAHATVDAMNRQIPKGLEQFDVLLGPVPGSTAYAVGVYLGIPGFTIETTEKMALEERIRYQILAVQMMLKELGVTLTCNPHS